jgi:AcrR family transcriptional regulator
MNNVQVGNANDRRKAARRVEIVKIAKRIIARKGLKALKIRDIAEAAKCSIGSVYNEFGDFDGVILSVNRETIFNLRKILEATDNSDPIRRLHGLAGGYLGFAIDHGNLLRSLFEHRMEGDKPFPEDLLQSVMETFALMHEPLERLLPDRRKTEVALLARMMFSAVHGIISLGLEERLVAVPPKNLHKLVAQFVDTHLAGLGISPSTIKGR